MNIGGLLSIQAQCYGLDLEDLMTMDLMDYNCLLEQMIWESMSNDKTEMARE